jgi:hypothetical protein
MGARSARRSPTSHGVSKAAEEATPFAGIGQLAQLIVLMIFRVPSIMSATSCSAGSRSFL